MTKPQAIAKKANRGFTLVELMVVIAIIAVLAAISIPVFSRTRENARQTRCTANLHAIAVALRSYMTDWNGFPLPYDSAKGTGGVTQLYLDGYLSSNRVLRCPDDDTLLDDYIKANNIDVNTSPGDRWKPKSAGGAGENFFADRYSSYNQLLLPNAATPIAYPLYNYYGYRGAGDDYRNGAQAVTVGSYSIQPTPAGTGPSGLMDDKTTTSEIGSLYVANGSTLAGGLVWAKAIYTDANHLFYYDSRVFDRDMSKSYNTDYGRPLWDTTSGSYTSYFPGLVNRNAPDNTIVTHCPYHRNWFGNNTATQQDLIVRLGGDTEKQKLGGYDWVVQTQSNSE